MAWDRIRPEPTMDEQCAFMAEYLLDCLVRDSAPDDFIHGGFESGSAIAAWLKHLVLKSRCRVRHCRRCQASCRGLQGVGREDPEPDRDIGPGTLA